MEGGGAGWKRREKMVVLARSTHHVGEPLSHLALRRWLLALERGTGGGRPGISDTVS